MQFQPHACERKPSLVASFFWAGYATILIRAGGAITRGFGNTSLGRMPAVARMLSALRRAAADHVIPSRYAWVRIQSGLGAGLWLHLNLTEERNWWSGSHEIAVQQELRECLHHDAVFYDVGAHIGFFSLTAAKLGARVFAFEADPENVDRLMRNVERNGLTSRITVAESAVWASGGPKVAFQRGLPRSQGGVSSSGIKPVLASGPMIEVDSVTIDDFVSAGGPVPDVIKVDVEGGEVEVLKGAAETIADFRPKLLLEIHHRAALSATEVFLTRFSYNAEWRIPHEGFPRQCFAAKKV